MKGSLRKLRNTARFLLGNLDDFAPEKAVPYEQLTGIDKYMLHKLQEFSAGLMSDYEEYQFSKGDPISFLKSIHPSSLLNASSLFISSWAVYRWLVNFATVDLSAFYFEIVKDRLYADPTDGLRRRSTQTVLRHTLDNLTTALAPIAPFTAQDIHRCVLPFGDEMIMKASS